MTCYKAVVCALEKIKSVSFDRNYVWPSWFALRCFPLVTIVSTHGNLSHFSYKPQSPNRPLLFSLSLLWKPREYGNRLFGAQNAHIPTT